ncbi:hypothetical protein PANT_10d00071 [Moesziomyces antarcticus T-34]|uniref:Uncharacterized protein n=1 Tax=Pseudozyma antarctica (strain T-34) TaxID=1151754 RepID=M9LPT4_PSEA3|nr:hypothetical protein PANT_10d00071 [Moesziomyces antarcticus T-34]
MSFGRPPTFSDFKVSPPERGSFPLDHEGKLRLPSLLSNPWISRLTLVVKASASRSCRSTWLASRRTATITASVAISAKPISSAGWTSESLHPPPNI